MKPLLSHQVGGVLLGLFALTSGAVLAQPADAVNPQSVAVEPSANEEPPPGSCKPIGFTVSGEIVFPMECKAFIERQKALDRKPAAQAKPAPTETEATAPQANAAAEARPASEGKPVAEEATPAAAQEKAANAGEKPVARQNDSVSSGTGKSSPEPVETGSLAKRAGREPGVVGPSGCTHFRTYNAASGSYRTFDGQRRPCREGGGKLVRNERPRQLVSPRLPEAQP